MDTAERNRFEKVLREQIARDIEEQGRLIKAIFEDDRHAALIYDLALMVRSRRLDK